MGEAWAAPGASGETCLADIFVSYARADHERVAPLVAALEAEGWSIWWDPEISPGEEFDAMISRELERAKAVLAVWTPISVNSRWVRGEARDGADRGLLVPVRLDGARLPIDFRALHTIDLDGWNGDRQAKAFMIVRSALAAKLDPARAPGRTVAGPQPARYGGGPKAPDMRRRMVILLVAMAVLGMSAMYAKRFVSPPALVDTHSPGDAAGEFVLPSDRSIAVLPFADLSPDGDNRYFSDGLSEALMDTLARIPELQVAARTSSFAYRDPGQDIREVAAALSVQSLLEGSVRKSGDQLKINARLVDGRSGRSLWTETFDATTEDVFSVQENIARGIAAALQITLLGSATLVPVTTLDPTAYEEYLRGRAELRRQGTPETLERALQYFSRALELEQGFMPARAGVCTTLWQKYGITRDATLAEQAIDACRDVEREENPPAEILVALAGLYRGTGQVDRAQALLERALEASPNDAEVHAALGETLREAGQLEVARAHHLRSVELDPSYWRYHWNLGRVLLEIGRLEEAAARVRRAIRLQPDSPGPYYTLGGIYFYQGDYLQAADAFRQSISSYPNAIAYSNAGTQYFYAGDYVQAEEMFRQAVAMSPADYRYHAFLAEAIELQRDSSGADARVHYEQAIRLGYQQLAINPEDHLCRAAVAGYLAQIGRHAEARTELQVLEGIEHMDMLVRRSLAMAYLFLGEADQAVEHFAAAVSGGYPPELFERDPRLAVLAGHPEFKRLVAVRPQGD